MEKEYVIVYGNKYETSAERTGKISEEELDKKVNELNLGYDVYHVFAISDEIKYEPKEIVTKLVRK